MVPNLSVLLQSNRGLTGLKSDGSTSYANYIIHFNSNSMAENVMTFGKTFFFFAPYLGTSIGGTLVYDNFVDLAKFPKVLMLL